jgi:hypothetical protein
MNKARTASQVTGRQANSALSNPSLSRFLATDISLWRLPYIYPQVQHPIHSMLQRIHHLDNTSLS